MHVCIYRYNIDMQCIQDLRIIWATPLAATSTFFSSCFQAAFLADQGKGQLEEVGNQRSVGRSGKQKPRKPWKFIEIRLILLESVIFLALCKATVGIWLKNTID